jgi:RNA polymerase sigma-54 factor
MPQLAGKQKQKQRQVFAPQMMRFMKLLSLPVDDLEAYFRTAAGDNPFLEFKSFMEKPFDFDEREADDFSGFAEEEDYGGYAGRNYSEGREKEFASEDPNGSFRASLRLQLVSLALESDLEYAGLMVIDALDNRGFFTQDVSEFAASASLPAVTARRSLEIIKSLDPLGCGAAAPSEVLSLRYPLSGPYSGKAKRMLIEDAEALAFRKLKFLSRKYGLSPAKIKAIIAQTRSLDPFPVTSPSGEGAFVRADIIVEEAKEREGFRIAVAGRAEEFLSIERGCLKLLRSLPPGEDRRYLNEQYKAAKALFTMTGMRRRTLLRLAEYLCLTQKDFFSWGGKFLRPCSPSDAAEALGVHPTTVIRCLSSKYILTRWGLYPLGQLFSRGVESDERIYAHGNSVRSVKEMIRSIIASGKGEKLSDKKIASILEESGVYLSRRTVAKYRSSLAIGNSRSRQEGA